MTCNKCVFWTATTWYDKTPQVGRCKQIELKIEAVVNSGWYGHYLNGIETDLDFGCNQYKPMEEKK